MEQLDLRSEGPEEVELDLREPIVRGRAQTIAARSLLAIIGVAGAIAAMSVVFGESKSAGANAGYLTETVWQLPPTMPQAALSDSTVSWQLTLNARPSNSETLDPMSGGLSATDVDNDGDLDLVTAFGTLKIFLWEQTNFGEPHEVSFVDAMSVTTSDVDSDGYVDLLVARNSEHDTIIWGGEWINTKSEPNMTALKGANPSSSLLAAELSGDTKIDIVRCGPHPPA